MDSALTAGLALVGAIVGAALSFFLQRANQTRAEEAAHAEQVRQDRISAYSDFAGIAMDYRRAELNYWHVKREQPDRTSPERAAAAAESRDRRAEAWHAYYRVRLLTDDSRLVDLAKAAVDAAKELHDAPDLTSLRAQGEVVREAVASFIDLARPSVMPRRRR